MSYFAPRHPLRKILLESNREIREKQPMEPLFSSLAAHGQPLHVVRSGAMAALNRFADVDIPLSNTLGHHEALANATVIIFGGEIEVEHDEGLIYRKRPHEVRIHHAFVPVQHEVRICQRCWVCWSNDSCTGDRLCREDKVLEN